MRSPKEIPLLHLTLLLSFLALSQGKATWSWMSPKAFLEESDLIAIVDVKDVHEVTTPEGFRLQTATATLEKVIFQRDDFTFSSKVIVVYSLDVNAIITKENKGGTGFAFPITSGKAFVCLKLRGIDKFYPYCPMSFQSIVSVSNQPPRNQARSVLASGSSIHAAREVSISGLSGNAS